MLAESSPVESLFGICRGNLAVAAETPEAAYDDEERRMAFTADNRLIRL